MRWTFAFGALGGTRTPNQFIRRTGSGSLWAPGNEPADHQTITRFYGVPSDLHRSFTAEASGDCHRPRLGNAIRTALFPASGLPRLSLSLTAQEITTTQGRRSTAAIFLGMRACGRVIIVPSDRKPLAATAPSGLGRWLRIPSSRQSSSHGQDDWPCVGPSPARGSCLNHAQVSTTHFHLENACGRGVPSTVCRDRRRRIERTHTSHQTGRPG